MLDRARSLFAPPTFEDDAKTRTARLLNTILIVYMAVLVVYGASSLIYPDPWITLAAVGIAALLGSVVLVLLRRGYVRFAAGMFHGFLWLILTASCVFYGGVNGPAFYGYIVVVVMTGFLQSGWSAFGYAFLSIATGVVLVVAESGGWLPTPLAAHFPLSEWLALSIYSVVAASVLYLATHGLNQALERARQNEQALGESYRELQAVRDSLEERVVARTSGLETAAEVSRAIASVLELEELLPQVAEVVLERFGLYYVGVFLLDSTGQWAVLRAGTGAAGLRMLENAHQLRVGGASMIGQCVALGEPRIALDVGDEAYRFDNPLLPETRSEMALPLRWRSETMGAMTIQSAVEAAFDDADVSLLQTVADQLAVAIRNAQLFAETQQALARSQAIMRRYVQDSWDRLVEAGTDVSGYRYQMGHAQPDEHAWLPAMEQAVKRRGAVAEVAEQQDASLAVPLTSGGEIIGAIGLRRPGGGEWSAEERAIVQSIGEQVAQAVERMRLLDETRRGAQREAILRQTADRVRSQADLDAILQVAAQELRRVVGATKVAIRLSPEAQQNGDRR